MNYEVPRGCLTCVRDRGVNHHCYNCIYNVRQTRDNWVIRPSLKKKVKDIEGLINET